MIYNTTSLVYIFNARCSRSVEHSIILLSSSNKSSDTDDTDKSFSILCNQNVAISRHSQVKLTTLPTITKSLHIQLLLLGLAHQSF